MIKNYFSDITDLFLKIKNEENIKINEEAKAEIRQMLQAKIVEMKSDTPTTDSPEKSFWSTWRYQLFGVPASLFAILLIVFAASNLKVSIPKEDFSPTREGSTQTVVVEKDRPLVKTAVKPLVIDYGENIRETRALNKVKTTTKTPAPVVETPKAEYTGGAVLVLDEPADEPATEPADEPAAQNIVEPRLEPIQDPDKTPLVEEVKVEYVVSLGNDIPVDTVVPTYPVYIYKDEDLKNQNAFTEESLLKLTKSKNPESVTVYYVEEKHVVVEIEEKGTTKWYLFDNLENNWTISRYEKYVTEDVVK